MNVFSTASYLAAALAFLLLSGMLAAAWGGRREGIRLLVASSLTAAWAGAIAAIEWSGLTHPLLFLLETLRQGAWLVVIAGMVSSAGWPGWLSRLAYGATALVATLVLIASANGGAWLVPAVLLGGLSLAVLGLMLLEQAYRNAHGASRNALKYLYIGVGGMYAYDLFMYSQGLLLAALSPDAWAARGLVFAFAVPFIAIAARRTPEWSLSVYVSRQATFYSTTFLAIGAYLLLMAAGGYIVRLIGGAWGAIAQIIFFAAAGAVLAGLILSAPLRRRFRVFVLKHFYRHKYDYRDEWLRFIETLSDSAASDDPRTASVRAVAQIIDSPSAQLFTYDRDRGALTRSTTWPAVGEQAETPRVLGPNVELVQLLHKREWVIDLKEQRDGSAIEGDILLPGWVLRSQWRLMVPVMLRSELYGVLLLAEPPGGFDLTYEDRDLLKTAARHVATHLAQHDAEQKVAEGQQFEAYSKLTAFMMHDLKNSAAQLKLLVENAKRHRDNPEFMDDAIDTVRNTAERLTRLTEQLHHGGIAPRRESVDLANVIARSIALSAGREPRPVVTSEVPAVRVKADAERLADVLQHVIRNAQDATQADGRIELRAAVEAGEAIVEVRDTGCGMTQAFIRDRLFRPFDTTKGVKGMGVGAYQAREYARSLGGDVEVRSEPGQGTLFRLILPAGSGQSVSQSGSREEHG